MLQDNVEMFPSEEFEGQMETDVAAFIDPRTPWMGVRILCNESSLELEDETIVRLDDETEYDIFRQQLGIPESGKEVGG